MSKIVNELWLQVDKISRAPRLQYLNFGFNKTNITLVTLEHNLK